MREVLKASFWTGLTTLCRAFSLLLIAKIIAVEIGPEGLGKIGQFLSLMTILTVVAGGGISNGLIRFVSEVRSNGESLRLYIGTGLTFSAIAAIAVAVVGFLFSKQLSYWLFSSGEYISLVLLLCGIQIAIAANNFLLAVINGHRDPRRFAAVTILGLLSGLGCTAYLAETYKLKGALVGLMLMQSLPLVFAILFVRLAPWYESGLVSLRWNKDAALGLAQYSGMAIATAIVTPITHMLLRNLLESRFDWLGVGYWQAATRISDVFMMFATMTLTAYYLPRLAEAKTEQATSEEVAGTFKVIVPLIGLGAGLVYVLRSFVVRILFSSDFTPVEALLGPQLLGDMFRVSSWILSYLMIARSMMKLFVLTEVVFAALYLGLCWWLTQSYGLQGSIWAGTISSATYLLLMAIIFRRFHFIGTWLTRRAS